MSDERIGIYHSLVPRKSFLSSDEYGPSYQAVKLHLITGEDYYEKTGDPKADLEAFITATRECQK